MSRTVGGELGEGLAPVIPLFAERPVAERVEASSPIPWNTTWDDDPDEDDEYVAYDEDDGYDACGAIEREIAEKNLLKRLRTRQLSVTEARAVVSVRDLGPDDVESVIEAFVRLGYLDDAALAEQLVHIGVDRKGQGRKVIAQAMAKRGIPRDIAEAALAALPDDDLERALEYARTKTHGMRDLDRDTALRRLAGQLARRGYGGSIAFDAAKRALDEQGSTPGVRFR